MTMDRTNSNCPSLYGLARRTAKLDVLANPSNNADFEFCESISGPYDKAVGHGIVGLPAFRSSNARFSDLNGWQVMTIYISLRSDCFVSGNCQMDHDTGKGSFPPFISKTSLSGH